MKKSHFIFYFIIGVMGSFIGTGFVVPSQAQVQPIQDLENHNIVQASAPTSLSWQEFTSAPGRYSVQLPDHPTQFTSTTNIPEGILTWQVAEVRIPPTEQSGTEYYLIAYTDIPTDHLARHSPDEIFRQVINEIMTEGRLEGSIQLQEPILFDNHPAQLVIGTVEDKHWVMVLSLVGERLYGGLAFSDERDRMTHFLDSFELSDRAAVSSRFEPATAVRALW